VIQRLLAVAAATVSLGACIDLVDSGTQTGGIVLAPNFGVMAPFAADADRLHIVVQRLSGGVPETVIDTNVTIDPVTGEAVVDLKVVLLQSPQDFIIILEAIRTSDGAILFQGVDTVGVVSGTQPTASDVPFAYVGPTGTRVEIAPKDTVIPTGGSIAYRATVYGASDAVVAEPVRFRLVNLADSLILRVDRLTGAAQSGTIEGVVAVEAYTPSGLTDGATALVGTRPEGVLITPGFANVQPTGSVQLTGAIVDAVGNPISGGGVTWLSRDSTIAAVNASGLVTGVAVGVTRVVAAGAVDPTLQDSILVTVAPSGNVVVTSGGAGRSFRAVNVGDTVTVDVAVDMRLTGSELLGSYNATLTWNAAALAYVDVQAGGFPAPQVNTANTSTGELRFAQANPSGSSGNVVVARVRLRALASATVATAVTISELSAAVTFTNLINQVTVTNGTVTVR
jgi:hypothetical protein